MTRHPFLSTGGSCSSAWSRCLAACDNLPMRRRSPKAPAAPRRQLSRVCHQRTVRRPHHHRFGNERRRRHSALGKRPRGIHASPDKKTIYVALSGSPIAGPGVDESTLPPADKTADGIGVFDIKERKC